MATLRLTADETRFLLWLCFGIGDLRVLKLACVVTLEEAALVSTEHSDEADLDDARFTVVATARGIKMATEARDKATAAAKPKARK